MIPSMWVSLLIHYLLIQMTSSRSPTSVGSIGSVHLTSTALQALWMYIRQYSFLLHWIIITLSTVCSHPFNTGATVPYSLCGCSVGSDCGLFAIAFATALCGGLDPHIQNFEQSKMREHLRECFDVHRLQRFPWSCRRRRLGRQ